MDLSSDILHQTIFPTAILTRSPYNSPAPSNLPTNTAIEWPSSSLNPKNRIDSLSPLPSAPWRIDGSANLGTQFFALPNPVLLFPLNPLRLDVFVPQSRSISPHLRETLHLSSALHLRDSRVANLAISHYIVRILSHWSSQHVDFKTFYTKLPFGSRIVIENFAADIRDIKIQVVPTHFLERQFLSSSSLRSLWNLPSTTLWPTELDISFVHEVSQLHDSVSVVEIAKEHYILKALTSSPKYLYHELKALLTLPPHPNVISRPAHLITKATNFGAKIAVIGFTLPYHERGSLRDIVTWRHIHGRLLVQDQMKWAVQLTEALICIRNQGRFYCDLRLDNVVVDTDDDLIMIDFEARGVALSASAPEVNYLEYVHTLVSDPDFDSCPLAVKSRFRDLYAVMVRERETPRTGDGYVDVPHGYSVPWLCLDEREREAAMVYMLGRTLWCIFEGVGSPEKTAVVQHLRESRLEFPEWKRTPAEMRDLVERCVRFVDEYRALPVVRRGRSLAARGVAGRYDAGEVVGAARRWWEDELDRAELFLRKRDRGEISAENYGRPSLDEVLLALKNFQCSDIQTIYGL